MTWDHQNDRYLLKVHLNLPKKFNGIPSGAYLNTEFLQDNSIPISKKKSYPLRANSMILLV